MSDREPAWRPTFKDPADAKRFTWGEEQHTHDGIHWIKGPCKRPPNASEAAGTVTAINRDRGLIVVDSG